MSNYSTPMAVDLGQGGQIYVAYEDVNGTGAVALRWFQPGDSKEQLPIAVAFPHYDAILRLIEILTWAVRSARQEEQMKY